MNSNRYTSGKDIEKALLIHSGQKDVIDRCEERYKNFDPETAVPTYDIMGKHIMEFRRRHSQYVPEIFVLLVSFFEVHPQLLKSEGLFRIAASIEKMDEL